MFGDLLTNLTLITNFLCMGISLWFAIYLLARSPANPLTFRAVVALLALAFYYNNAFTDIVNLNSDSGPVRSLAILIALVAAHDLTHYLLPLPQRKRLYWVARGIVLMGVIAIVLLFTAPSGEECDPRYTCPSNIMYPWLVIDFFKVVFFSAILYNLWVMQKSETRLENVAFFEALLLGASTIAYGFIGTVLNLDLPRFVPNLAMLSALTLLLYSVARNQTFIARRTSPFDLPITLLTISAIVGLYVVTAWQIGLSATSVLLLVVLAIFTHSAYDFVRELIDRMFRAQQGRVRQELRQIARDTSSEETLPRFLKRGLTILCHNLRATNGLIALRQGNQYEVVASLHCLPVGSQLPVKDIPTESNLASVNAELTGYKLGLVPAFVGPEQVAVIGVGPRKDNIPYSEDDLYWLEDIAEEMGWMIHTCWKGRLDAAGALAEPSPATTDEVREPLDGFDTSELLSKLAYKPNPELVRCVEEGLRNLKDYSKLGRSPLVSMFAIQAQDHIESGKLVQRKLIEIIEKLRPAGEMPAEPLPREWYAYTILHDAYVEECLAREIMAKLYISEGTYYRMRRRALRGITRVMLEGGAIA